MWDTSRLSALLLLALCCLFLAAKVSGQETIGSLTKEELLRELDGLEQRSKEKDKILQELSLNLSVQAAQLQIASTSIETLHDLLTEQRISNDSMRLLMNDLEKNYKKIQSTTVIDKILIGATWAFIGAGIGAITVVVFN